METSVWPEALWLSRNLSLREKMLSIGVKTCNLWLKVTALSDIFLSFLTNHTFINYFFSITMKFSKITNIHFTKPWKMSLWTNNSFFRFLLAWPNPVYINLKDWKSLSEWWADPHIPFKSRPEERSDSGVMRPIIISEVSKVRTSKLQVAFL